MATLTIMPRINVVSLYLKATASQIFYVFRRKHLMIKKQQRDTPSRPEDLPLVVLKCTLNERIYKTKLFGANFMQIGS